MGFDQSERAQGPIYIPWIDFPWIDPWIDFLMVIMVSGIVRGRVRTTATESHKIAAILQQMGWERHAP